MSIARLEKVISGGQTGADRAALDWAINHGIPHGGWCPKGRRAEGGIITERYCLKETPQSEYRQRTQWNVRDADGTLILTLTGQLTGGALFTRQCAERIGLPYLHVVSGDEWPDKIKVFLEKHSIRILNVAGPRASSAPGIEQFVQEVLTEMKAIA
jgi:Circularly permutated YpsA SLOG family